MARITMRNVQKSPVEQYFNLFLSSAAARGVKDKTLQTYKQHFHSISKRMDVTVPMDCLNSSDLDNMILKMREEGLSDCSINSYILTPFSPLTDFWWYSTTTDFCQQEHQLAEPHVVCSSFRGVDTAY